MNKNREHLCPVWLALVLGGVVIAALAAAYPRANVHTRSLSMQRGSMISVAYLEAWLLLEPGSAMYMESLAMQYLELGRWQSALEVSRRLQDTAQDSTGRQKAVFLELVASEQMAYALPEGSEQREQGVQRVAGILRYATELSWNVPATRSLAEKARLAGADDAMVRFYQQLALIDTGNTSHWQARLAEAAVATQAYESAAFSFFRAYETADSLDEKRRYFIKGLQTLESAGKVEQACQEGELRLGVLANDSRTLRYLLALARQANRSELAADYARSLLATLANPQAETWQEAAIVRVVAGVPAPRPEASVDTVVLAQEYQLVYQAFIESGALDDAERVARMALDMGLDRQVWSARLAQAAQWNQHPDVALTHWLWYAQASNDKQAWQQVLALAPGQEADDAYLAAWIQQARLEGTVTNEPIALNALLAEYTQAGRWTSALRVLERLKAFDPESGSQRNLLLEVAALEQHAYEFADDDARRTETLQRMHDVMSRAMAVPMDLSSTQWLAQRAHATGADTMVPELYRRLVVQDPANAAHWHEKLGEFKLGRQAYEAAATAYFAAQAAAMGQDEKRRYFQLALGSYVAGGNVGLACDEGDRRAEEWMSDSAALRYLIGLARQAHRTDLMTRYARALIQAGQGSRSAMRSKELADDGLDGVTQQMALWRPQRLPVFYADFDVSKPVARHLMANGTGEQLQDVQGDTAADLDVAFLAFLESRQLDDAEKTARQALDGGLDPLLWMSRLAQVTQWNNKPVDSLHYWLRYAQKSGDSQAWTNVLLLSMQLNDNAAQLAALRHMSGQSPHDMGLLDQVVHAYEALGQPQAGLRYLKGRAQGALRVPMLERYAGLAERSGNDEAAREAYETLSKDGGRPHLYATRLAAMDYAQGQLVSALTRLRDVRDQVGTEPETAPYWRLYGELARLKHNAEDAVLAHAGLLQSGQATDADLDTLTHIYELHPIDGGRLAEMQFRNTGSPAALQTALRMYVAIRAWARIETLLESLTPEQQAYFRQSGQLLATRADYYVGVGNWRALVYDLRLATSLPDANDYTRIAYLWSLIGFGSENELRQALHRWRATARMNSEYWSVYAAAQMRLGNPTSAVHYLRAQRLAGSQDPLWWMLLADAEQASGHEERARGIRDQAWALLQERSAQLSASDESDYAGAPRLFASPAEDARLLDAARVSLSQMMANGDYSRTLLVRLLNKERRLPQQAELAQSLLGDKGGLPEVSQVVPAPARGSAPWEPGLQLKETVLAWALSGGHEDLARAWLAQQYPERVHRPINPEAALALMDADVATLGDLLEDGRKSLSPESRLEALVHTGQMAEAQTLAFNALDGAQESDERHQAFTDLMIRDRPAVGFDIAHAALDPLKYTLVSMTAGLKLTNRWGFSLTANDRHQRTTDTSVLAWVPGNDRELSFTLYNVTPERKFSIRAGTRKASETFQSISLNAELNRTGTFRPSIFVGLNQATDVSQVLQVAGAKDMIQLGWQWEPGPRWFMWGNVQAARLLDQGRTYIGRELQVSSDLGYRLSQSHPDWNIRLTATRGVYSAGGNVIHRMRKVLPAGHSLAASELMPDNFTQYGVLLGYGASDEMAYWRRWRTFMDAGYVHDSEKGWGPVANVGLGGSVFGSDHLQILYSYTAARKGDSSSSTRIGMSYRLFF